MRPVWVPNLNHFYTGIKRASTTFINYFVLGSTMFSTMFHPMRTLLDASLLEGTFTRDKAGVNHFYHFF